ncbi:hypothetical protein CesoFtcFv8_027541 [Champsocephalus esox]|uniref:Uncharacterized protein n=1 Tax=Champsocephalus esox TaxID=159716 RepID=A0AAN8ATU3_9TELE|nr:hypothetical protein CesoFtcFv8_027541 [Champsocephalus esox]
MKSLCLDPTGYKPTYIPMRVQMAVTMGLQMTGFREEKSARRSQRGEVREEKSARRSQRGVSEEKSARSQRGEVSEESAGH